MVNKQKPTIALFGGSFDPPHKGHQRIVEKAIENLACDQLLVVPAYLNPFKTSTLANAHMRLLWCQTLFDPIDHVRVDDFEIKEGKSTVTSDSVKHFNQTYTVKYLIIGSDNLSTLAQWHAFEWLNERVIWVIATRGNHPLDTEKLREWQLLHIEVSISSTYIREEKDLQFIDKKIKASVKYILEGQDPMTIDERIAGIVNVLDDKKAEEIEVFNLEDADYIAKRVVIANSLNGKHTIALFEHLKIALKEQNDGFLASDISDDWAVGDLGDILVHIMIPEYRQRYSLETFLSELLENQKKNKDIDPA